MIERRTGRLTMLVAAIAVAAAAAGCAGGSATASPSPSSTPSPVPTEASPSPSASVAAESPSASTGVPGAATLDAPASVKAGAEFEVAWTGPAGQGDYITMVVMGLNQRTNEPTIPLTSPSPAKLVAPTTPGEYELWYVRGASDLAMARRPITVTP